MMSATAKHDLDTFSLANIFSDGLHKNVHRLKRVNCIKSKCNIGTFKTQLSATISNVYDMISN